MRAVAMVGPVGRSSDGPALGGPKQRLVLALLLAEPNSVVSVDRLVDEVWGGEPPETARHTVQAYVSELRKALGPSIERTGTGYRINVSRDTLDTLDFEARVSSARAEIASDPAHALVELEFALTLWHGPAFQDFPDQATLQVERARLDELRLVAVEDVMRARLTLGRHAEVIVELERLTRDNPYREELRALHMLALYRTGRQADALRAYQRTREVLDEELGIAPSPRLRRLEEQILLQDPDLEPRSVANHKGARSDRRIDNPYLGLRAFREEDETRFYGQDELVERLMARVLSDRRFTAVVGPSGSGKSSVVQAGLVPRLRRECPNLLVTRMQPGAQPFTELQGALDRVLDDDRRQLREGEIALRDAVIRSLPDGSSRLFLVIDQFEELFTMVQRTEASRFLGALVAAVDDPAVRVHVLVTLRADVYDRPLADPQFGRLFADNVVNVVPLGPEQLEAAATLPARQLDIDVEPRLIGRLIADVTGQPNALPLFQYALTELFDERSGPTLDLATYERIGGVRKAVGRRAESLYAGLDAEEKEAARQLFLRIATVTDNVVGRRRVPASELVSLDVDVVALRAAIDTFARYRLVVLDRDPVTASPTIDIAHEALLTEWHRLRDWIDQSRDDLAQHASFAVAVNEWETSGRDAGYLLTGTRLANYERWAATTRLRLTSTERAYIDESVTARERASADTVERAATEARLRQRSRRQLVLLDEIVAVLAGLISSQLLRRFERDPYLADWVRASERDSIVAALEKFREFDPYGEQLARGVESATNVVDELRRAADEDPALMFGTSLMQKAMLGIADEHPDTTFVAIDYVGLPNQSNVVGVNFAVEEGSFLVGAAAALESATGKVGYIGANSLDFIEAFRAGFEQGARAANPEIEVVAELIVPATDVANAAQGYDAPDIARRIASRMYVDEGVDVIFAAAGGSGQGVIQAATELTRPDQWLWAIGVDSDQFFGLPSERQDHLLTSMPKRLDVGVQAVTAAHANGTLVVPSTLTLGLADGAVGYTDTGGHLRSATIQRLEEFRAEIIAGTRAVDAAPDQTIDSP